MVLNQNAILLVKLKSPQYDYPKWEEYRMNKGRNLQGVFNWLLGLDSFRYAIIFKYDRINRSRGQQIGYIDKRGGVQIY